MHWKAWQEAYPGLVSQDYPDGLTLETCVRTAYQWRDNILVVKDGERVIGFAAYGAYRDSTLPNTGEMDAIYILADYYHQRVGESLMRAAPERIPQYKRVALWVLKGNERAIRFYRKIGFRFDGTEQADCTEIRMMLDR